MVHSVDVWCLQAGWVTPTLALTVVWFLSSFAATMLCDAMQRIPGNDSFEKRCIASHSMACSFAWRSPHPPWCGRLSFRRAPHPPHTHSPSMQCVLDSFAYNFPIAFF